MSKPSDDIGLRTIADVFQRLQIDAEWSVRDGRRFTWWMGNHAQEVYASQPTMSHGMLVSRLVARTPLVIGVEPTPHHYEQLGALNAYLGTMSGLVLGNDDVVRLVTTAVTHRDINTWMPDHFALRAAVQAADAEIMAERLAKTLGGQVAHSAHPSSGPRPEYDDLASIIELLVAPKGQEASMWSGREMQIALDWLKKLSLLATGDESSVTAEFPYRDFSSLLQFTANDRHPQVGNGLHVALKLPSPPFGTSPHENAALLNLMEARGLSLTTTLHGAWCVAPGERGDTVAFSAFFPNAFHLTDLAANIALWMAGKAEWVASLGDSRSREERWEEGKPAIAHIMAMCDDAE
jgi:hypothetical protein